MGERTDLEKKLDKVIERWPYKAGGSMPNSTLDAKGVVTTKNSDGSFTRSGTDDKSKSTYIKYFHSGADEPYKVFTVNKDGSAEILENGKTTVIQSNKPVPGRAHYSRKPSPTL